MILFTNYNFREGGVLGLFGWNLMKNADHEVVVTSSEFDAMILGQETGKPVLSLPKGTSVLPVGVSTIPSVFFILIYYSRMSANPSFLFILILYSFHPSMFMLIQK